MIGCTKLLCGTATVSETLRAEQSGEKVPARLLQFSSDLRPLVVWNVTNRCNLRCKHCYISAEDRAYRDELTTAEAREFLKDIGEMGCPVLLLSGGEPLVRKDIYALAEFGAQAGLRVVLSTNGTLITPEVAGRLAASGVKYVGVSLDGAQAVHDAFRGRKGCFEEALAGLKHAAEAGLNTGVRFTVNKENVNDLPAVIEAVVEHGVPRFCMYHLVYTGRGEEMMDLDTDLAEKRLTMEFLAAKTKQLRAAGTDVEILTVDNHADGVFIYRQVLEEQPERAEEVLRLLEMHGGCSAGVKISNVAPQGDVHPCQFWPHATLGNVRERKFSEIWRDESNELLARLRSKPEHLKGRCGACAYKGICGGCRIRAERVYGDVWAADPACYLTDEEIRQEAGVSMTTTADSLVPQSEGH